MKRLETEWEELLLEIIDEDKMESKKLLANEEIVAQLVSMGFNHLHCQKAAINTSNAGVEEAMNWLLSHMDDPGIANQTVAIDICFSRRQILRKLLPPRL